MRAKTNKRKRKEKSHMLHFQIRGIRGDPLLGHFDDQVGKARELIFHAEDNLFRFCDPDLALLGFVLGARNVDVVARCVDQLADIRLNLGSLPKMQLFQRGEFVCA